LARAAFHLPQRMMMTVSDRFTWTRWRSRCIRRVPALAASARGADSTCTRSSRCRACAAGRPHARRSARNSASQ